MLRCASKWWNDIITSPLFSVSHLEQSTENDELLFVEPYHSPGRFRPRRIRFVSVDMEGKGESKELYNVSVPDSCYQLDWLVSSGLVCFSKCGGIYMCNPVRQQLCELPKGSPSIFPGPDQFGFGYLHSKKEYKVVRFFYQEPRIHLPNLHLAHLRCEMFTLNGLDDISNTRWEEIDEMPLSHPVSTGMLVNECMYWLANTFRSTIYTEADGIVSFDFENEKFLTISCPSSFETSSDLSMMDLKGMICLPDMDRFETSLILDLWILKDKISCIWVKEYSINLVKFKLDNIASSFGTWNEELMFTHSGVVIFINLKTNCSRGVKSLHKIDFGIYRKSLFSLRSKYVCPS